jgi:AraC family transcriptional regulator of adaptative response/methylated-DNA-[protein]-cysteine methyltransferase
LANTAWRAILVRDRGFDGNFVYAVHSTGLYCRPSCPARHPLRRNTVLYETAEDAERDGYAACSRCSPGTRSETLAESCVKAVIHHIESHVSQKVTVRNLAEVTGLSPSHLQHVFRRITGLTPKAYHEARRLERLKERLRLGESVAGSGYGAGYGSSRALYEGIGKRMGMTPSIYRGGGGVRIRYAFIASSRGAVLVAGTRDGLCAVIPGANRRVMLGELRLEYPKAHLALCRPPPNAWAAAVGSSESEDPFVRKLPLAVRRRIFRARVALSLSRRPPA